MFFSVQKVFSEVHGAVKKKKKWYSKCGNCWQVQVYKNKNKTKQVKSMR